MLDNFTTWPLWPLEHNFCNTLVYVESLSLGSLTLAISFFTNWFHIWKSAGLDEQPAVSIYYPWLAGDYLPKFLGLAITCPQFLTGYSQLHPLSYNLHFCWDSVYYMVTWPFCLNLSKLNLNAKLNVCILLLIYGCIANHKPYVYVSIWFCIFPPATPRPSGAPVRCGQQVLQDTRPSQ